MLLSYVYWLYKKFYLHFFVEYGKAIMLLIETKLISGQMASKMAAKVLAGFGGFFGYFAISATELS